ncbi:MAG: hypothetical protein N3A69_13325, partial [Leptospiraceae bacterium]|nr:hypothetical protein [Leptospiraceae bacterium]
MKTTWLRYFRKKKAGIRRNVKKVIQSRWLITIFITFFLITASFGISNHAYIYFLQENNIDIFQIKNLILQFIKTELKKAVEIGMVNVNIVDDISLEDIRISAEEDFSNNKILFSAKRMDLRLSSIFSRPFRLEKIVFHNSKLEIDPNFDLQKISKHLFEQNFPTLEFKNLVLILKKDNEIFARSTKPLNLIFRRKGNYFFIHGDDAVFFNRLFKQVQLQGTWELVKKELELKIELNDFPLEKISGITKVISLFESQEGTTSGFLQYHSSPEEVKIDGNLDFYSMTGFFLTQYMVHSLTMNTQFSYLANEEATYFNRKLNNPHFVCEIFYNKKSDGNILNRVSGSFEDLEKLQWSREETEDLQITGKLNFDISLEEFSKGNEAFQIFGNLSLNNFSISDSKTKLFLLIKDGGFRTDSSGELRGSLDGSLFSEKFQFNFLGNLKYLRNRDISSFTVQSNISSKLELEKYIQTDYEPLFEKIIQAIE